MPVDPIADLLAAIDDARAFALATVVVGFFATFAILLWSWRKVTLDDEEPE